MMTYTLRSTLLAWALAVGATLMLPSAVMAENNPAQEEKPLADTLADLTNFSSQVRVNTLLELSRITDEEVLKANDLRNRLFDVLENDTNMRVRVAVTAAMYNWAINGVKLDKSAERIMALASNDEEPTMLRRNAVKVLGVIVETKKFHYKEIRVKALNLLDDNKEESMVRAQVLLTLGAWGGQDNFTVILENLRNKDPEVARAAIDALAKVARGIEIDRTIFRRIHKVLQETNDEDGQLAILRSMSSMKFNDTLEKEKELVSLVKKYIKHQNEEIVIYTAVIAQNAAMVKTIGDIANRLNSDIKKIDTGIQLVRVLGGFVDRLKGEPKLSNKKTYKEIFDILTSLLKKSAGPEALELGRAIAWVLGDAPPCIDRTEIYKILSQLIVVKGKLGSDSLNSLQMVTGELYDADPEKWTKWVSVPKNAKRLKAQLKCD